MSIYSYFLPPIDFYCNGVIEGYEEILYKIIDSPVAVLVTFDLGVVDLLLF
jgi:hypothetical protein